MRRALSLCIAILLHSGLRGDDGPAPQPIAPAKLVVQPIQETWAAAIVAVGSDRILVQGFPPHAAGGITLWVSYRGCSVILGNPIDWYTTSRMKADAIIASYSVVIAVQGDHITVHRWADVPATEIRLSPQLAAGIAPKDKFYYGHGYLPCDLAVGDIVRLQMIRKRDEKGPGVCEMFSIRRRPGGRVPPSRVVGLRGELHDEHMNAQVDWEERGIPMPAKFVGQKQAEAYSNYLERRKSGNRPWLEVLVDHGHTAFWDWIRYTCDRYASDR